MIIFKKNNIFIFIILIFLYLFLSIFQFYIHKQKVYEELSNNLYTNNASLLITKKSKELLDINDNINYRIFLEKNNNFRYILKNKGEWSPPLISGYFFKENAKEAIVGQEMKNYIINKNDKEYITYEGEIYKVIGIMGASFPSSIDYLILLNNPNIKLNTSNRVVIDSEKKSSVKKMINYIKDKDDSVSIVEDFQKGLLRTGKINNLSIFLVIEVYLLVFTCFIFILRYWYEQEKKIVTSLYLLGISFKKIYIELLKISICIVLLSYFISQIFFNLFFNFYSVYINNAIIFIIMIIFIDFLVITCFVFKSYRKNKGVVRGS